MADDRVTSMSADAWETFYWMWGSTPSNQQCLLLWDRDHMVCGSLGGLLETASRYWTALLPVPLRHKTALLTLPVASNQLQSRGGEASPPTDPQEPPGICVGLDIPASRSFWASLPKVLTGLRWPFSTPLCSKVPICLTLPYLHPIIRLVGCVARVLPVMWSGVIIITGWISWAMLSKEYLRDP